MTRSSKQLADQGKLGQVSYTWGGEAQTSADEFPYLIQAVLLGIILSYMLMAALFNNMLYPLSVMLTLPQALVGALAALLLTGTPFSLITAIGVIMLNGIATKNAILMVDYTNTLRARGYKRMDAILEAAPTRLRPVLMTSFAIVCATLPTAAGLGRGAGFRQPLGITVVGGVIVSTFLTLLVIPSVYLLFDNFANWLGRVVWHRQIPEEALAYSGTDRDGAAMAEMAAPVAARRARAAEAARPAPSRERRQTPPAPRSRWTSADNKKRPADDQDGGAFLLLKAVGLQVFLVFDIFQIVRADVQIGFFVNLIDLRCIQVRIRVGFQHGRRGDGGSKRATAREGRLGQLVQVNFTLAVASQEGTPLKVAPQSLQRISFRWHCLV